MGSNSQAQAQRDLLRVQEVIVSAKSEEVVNPLNRCGFEDRPLATEEGDHHR